MKLRILISLFLVSSALFAIQLFVLKSLDYSTSKIELIDPADVTASSPYPDFRLGSVVWDLEYYSKTPDLDAFRTFFNSNCTGLKGIAAASCISDRLVEAIPFGEPSDEIFLSNYAPAEHLAEALKGRPGHCVTYSTITANSLLSAGIPARYVQTLPKEKNGHNIIEVWDDTYKWVAFDPLSDSIFSDGEKILSAAEAHAARKLERREAMPDLPTAGHLTNYYIGENPFAGTILFVEPWLHTRTGSKDSNLARGTFLLFGNTRFDLWPLHPVLRYGIFACGLLSVISFVIILVLFSQRLLRRRVGSQRKTT